MDERQKRMRLLEEALAECIDWIKAQDLYDDNCSGDRAWVRDGVIQVQPPFPGDSYSSAAALQATIDEAFDLVSRSEALFPRDSLDAARARARTRRRLD